MGRSWPMPPVSSWLSARQHAEAGQIKLVAVAVLAFDQLQAVDLALGLPVGLGGRQRRVHGGAVGLDAPRRGGVRLEAARLRTGQPPVEGGMVLDAYERAEPLQEPVPGCQLRIVGQALFSSGRSGGAASAASPADSWLHGAAPRGDEHGFGAGQPPPHRPGPVNCDLDFRDTRACCWHEADFPAALVARSKGGLLIPKDDNSKRRIDLYMRINIMPYLSTNPAQTRW
jgi:hypothetical protein